MGSSSLCIRRQISALQSALLVGLLTSIAERPRKVHKDIPPAKQQSGGVLAAVWEGANMAEFRIGSANGKRPRALSLTPQIMLGTCLDVCRREHGCEQGVSSE